MQPKPGLSQDQFDEWYNNEHGPTRLRIPSIFANGFRYKAADGEQPGFMAVYDVKSMQMLETPTYTTLRANRSPREADTIGQVDVKRYFYDLVHTKQSPLFMPIENLSDEEAKALVTVAVEMNLNDAEGAQEQYQSWYIEEHAEMLSKVPGWLRSRLFKTSSIEKSGKVVYFCLHDYAKNNGLGGPEHKASMDTPRRTEVFDKVVGAKGRRTFELFYTFGPAARDLSSLANLPDSAAFTSADKLTTTIPGANCSIKSHIETEDGLSIPYCLEGNSSPDASTIAFCNSLLTSYAMWDPLVEILKKQRPDLRILRYDTRGRHFIPQPPKAATLITVTDDLLIILRALRIEKLHTLIGVSMGGATTLNFALTYPERVSKVIAADFNCTSSDANTQAWKDRIAVAQADSGKGINNLSEQTVARWFHPDTITNKPDVAHWMTEMVAANNVEGFANSCTALWDYDLKPILPTCKVPSLLVVGEADGKGAVVKAMEGFKGLIGEKGTELRIVPKTGHLPMCEAPQSYWDTVKDFI
jgi:pimeloyl-ACP methyl ester carboxylesterase